MGKWSRRKCASCTRFYIVGDHKTGVLHHAGHAFLRRTYISQHCPALNCYLPIFSLDRHPGLNNLLFFFRLRRPAFALRALVSHSPLDPAAILSISNRDGADECPNPLKGRESRFRFWEPVG